MKRAFSTVKIVKSAFPDVGLGGQILIYTMLKVAMVVSYLTNRRWFG